MNEVLHDLGFINSERKHVMISVSNPTLTNGDNNKFIQVILTLENAIELRDKLNNFIDRNDL